MQLPKPAIRTQGHFAKQPIKPFSKNETLANFATKAIIHQRVAAKESSMNETSDMGCGVTEAIQDHDVFEGAQDTMETHHAPASPTREIDHSSPITTPSSPEVKFSLIMGQKHTDDGLI